MCLPNVILFNLYQSIDEIAVIKYNNTQLTPKHYHVKNKIVIYGMNSSLNITLFTVCQPVLFLSDQPTNAPYTAKTFYDNNNNNTKSINWYYSL